MFSFINSIIQFFMYWMFLYVCAIFLLVFGVTYLIKTNPTPIIHEHKIVQNIIKPQKRVLVEREICKDPRGCEILKVVNVRIVLWTLFGNEGRIKSLLNSGQELKVLPKVLPKIVRWWVFLSEI